MQLRRQPEIRTVRVARKILRGGREVIVNLTYEDGYRDGYEWAKSREGKEAQVVEFSSESVTDYERGYFVGMAAHAKQAEAK